MRKLNLIKRMEALGRQVCFTLYLYIMSTVIQFDAYETIFFPGLFFIICFSFLLIYCGFWVWVLGSWIVFLGVRISVEGFGAIGVWPSGFRGWGRGYWGSLYKARRINLLGKNFATVASYMNRFIHRASKQLNSMLLFIPIEEDCLC